MVDTLTDQPGEPLAREADQLVGQMTGSTLSSDLRAILTELFYISAQRDQAAQLLTTMAQRIRVLRTESDAARVRANAAEGELAISQGTQLINVDASEISVDGISVPTDDDEAQRE